MTTVQSRPQAIRLISRVYSNAKPYHTAERQPSCLHSSTYPGGSPGLPQRSVLLFRAPLLNCPRTLNCTCELVSSGHHASECTTVVPSRRGPGALSVRHIIPGPPALPAAPGCQAAPAAVPHKQGSVFGFLAVVWWQWCGGRWVGEGGVQEEEGKARLCLRRQVPASRGNTMRSCRCIVQAHCRPAWPSPPLVVHAPCPHSMSVLPRGQTITEDCSSPKSAPAAARMRSPPAQFVSVYA